MYQCSQGSLNDNLVIKVKKNIKLKEPISIFYYNCEQEKYLINNRINIILEENAEAEINEIFFSNNKSIYWNNVHNYICLKKNSISLLKFNGVGSKYFEINFAAV